MNSVLRSHSIKPHWMFALDNLVRSSVQAAITVLSPELGVHLAEPAMGMGQPLEPPPLGVPEGVEPHDNPAPDPDGKINMHPATMVSSTSFSTGASTSGVSTVHSAQAALVSGHHQHSTQYHHLHQLREENSRLLAQLLEMQQNYQDLLRHNLAEQRLHFQVLTQTLPKPSDTARFHFISSKLKY